MADKHHRIIALIATLLVAFAAMLPLVAAEPTPDAPTGLKAMAGDGKVTLSWDLPASEPDSAITSYNVYRGTSPGGEELLGPAGNSLTYTDTAVTNGQTYYYQVTSVNASGESPRSNEASASPAAASTAPSAPQNLAAAASDTQITLNWAAPASDGGSGITNYKIYRGTTAGDESLLTTVGNVLTYSDTGLTNGQAYYYKVSAVNSIGESSRSNEASATPTASSTVPSAPTLTSATAGNAQATLSWTAGSDGGSAITGFKIYRGTTAGGETLLTTLGSVLTYTDAGLTNGQTYYYKVSAVNEKGEGMQSNEASATPAAPATTPSAPQGLEAVAGDGQVTLSWTPPASDGGAAIDHYFVYQNGTEITTSTGTSVVITGLANSVEYSFTVAAHNSAGSGANSTAVTATPRPGSTVPAVPTGVQATPGDGKVALSWSAPVNNGGAAIDYYVLYQDGVEVARPTGTLAVVSNLVNGVQYNFTVAAHNSVGIGPHSAAVTATPSATVTVPGAPGGLTVTPGDEEAYLSWAAPGNNGGVTIDHYVVYRDGVDVLHTSETFATISGLSNGFQYNFTVSAHNSAGEGPRSSLATVTPSSSLSAPGAPTDLKVTPGNGQVTLSWKAPGNTGSSPIDYYIVYMNGVEVAHPTGTYLVLTDLTNGQEYRFIVAAHNSVGIGGMTSSHVATPKDSSMFSDIGNVLMWVVGVALFVILGLGVLLMMRRRSEEPSLEPPEEDEPPAPVSAPPKPPAAIAPAVSRTAPVTSMESTLCPRCGRPNSGRAFCGSCGKKLR